MAASQQYHGNISALCALIAHNNGINGENNGGSKQLARQ